jgi:NADH:ubiquinone oxidoreductase subunit F (NADH-binding)
VLDGAVLAAHAVGTRDVLVRVPERAQRTVSALSTALNERRDRVQIALAPAPAGYVTGEESAIVNALNGGPPLPTFVPPRPYQRGYRRRPTLVQNAETLAQVALIARYGARWFRELGTPADPGSALVTVSGAVTVPGVYELAFGTPMDDLLGAAGGPSEPLRALLVGGYFGTWVAAAPALSLQLAREDLRSVGCSLGSGVIFALSQRACGLAETVRLMDYLAAQSARQCGPCVYGLRAIADGVAALHEGRAEAPSPATLARWIADIRGRGACHHPDGAVRFIASALRVFGSDLHRHRRGQCPGIPAGLPLGDAPEFTGRRNR